jgi:hypothetical protein
MRKAELMMALVLGVFSAYLMWKSSELPILWIAEEGPGGGAFPFWLSLGMLVCCIVIVTRWFARADAPAKSTAPFMDAHGAKTFFLVAGSLTVMIGLIHFIGVYFSVPLFLLFYIRVLGGHSWRTTGALSLGTPVVTFFFFEIALKITLPKGYTEPMFYPLYDIFM